jgi:hypothetical protein
LAGIEHSECRIGAGKGCGQFFHLSAFSSGNEFHNPRRDSLFQQGCAGFDHGLIRLCPIHPNDPQPVLIDAADQRTEPFQIGQVVFSQTQNHLAALLVENKSASFSFTGIQLLQQ